ncbi:hypothetical protein FJR48_01540 [Sulfurimonas lithotrophica]|uniref:Periplasmic protein n=1 Tax=Sulfurimonas lithotrophica TaxID=2590022 RepID=A0A5P8NYI5_9BACT|nr:hypothetical protein [Sulfurimonas lithotrophica]QFR48476.1 hypothetical protein FJR48_01540 [Sulfurimonas lithotrophica]
MPSELLEYFQLEYIVVIMAGIILYLLYYVYSKDALYNRNIHSIASVVEELNREIFYLKKNTKELEVKSKVNSKHMSDEEIYQEIERSVYDLVHPLSQALKQMQESVDMIEAQVDTRVSNLESGVKQISIPGSIHANDDTKVISLYKQGVNIETISKELHISKAEVEFVLKINEIK